MDNPGGRFHRANWRVTHGNDREDSCKIHGPDLSLYNEFAVAARRHACSMFKISCTPYPLPIYELTGRLHLQRMWAGAKCPLLPRALGAPSQCAKRRGFFQLQPLIKDKSRHHSRQRRQFNELRAKVFFYGEFSREGRYENWFPQADEINICKKVPVE